MAFNRFSQMTTLCCLQCGVEHINFYRGFQALMILKMQCVLVLVWDNVCEKEISFLAFGLHYGFWICIMGPSIVKHCAIFKISCLRRCFVIYIFISLLVCDSVCEEPIVLLLSFFDLQIKY
jgi:hypothetical protein